LPKLYYPTPDELQGALPLNENEWFEQYQRELLGIVNTNEGRDLFCIDPFRQMPYPIVNFTKNQVRYFIGTWDKRDHFISDTRIGSKWGNVARYRWQSVKQAIDDIIRVQISRLQPIFRADGRRIPVLAGAAETVVYPDPNPETSSADGYTRHTVGAGASWDTIHDGAGTQAGPDSAEESIIRYKTTSSAWEYLNRSVFVFDTSGIGDADTLDSAILSWWVTYIALNTFPQDGKLNVYASAPASDTAVVSGDFDSFSTTAFSTGILRASLSTGAYNAFALNSDGLAALNFDAVSKYGGREELFDVSDTEPTHSADKTFDVSIYFADRTGTSNDPKLVIQHTSAFTPKMVMF
jgi:hypothetical protein